MSLPATDSLAIACAGGSFKAAFAHGTVELPVFSWGKGSTVLLVDGWGGYGVQLS